MKSDVVVAILAKDKGYCLPLYLQCLLSQTFPKDCTRLWIRTNDNTDNTTEVLERFIADKGHLYKSVVYDKSSVDEELKQFGEHEWNAKRFDVLARLRQESVDYAIETGSHYFVVDCDNFITHDVLQQCYTSGMQMVGPMLRLGHDGGYANYHHRSTPEGWYEDTPEYYPIYHRTARGLIEVDTLHCTYFIDNDTLPHVTYNDGTGRYEYAILAANMRHLGIPQYLDNRKFYGFLFLNDQIASGFDRFLWDYWREELIEMRRIHENTD